MKNLLENLAVGLVILLSLGIIGLVVQYNLISNDEDKTTEYSPEVLQSLQSIDSKKEKKTSYLDTLEGYEDVDVKIDPHSEESNLNIAVVKTETKKEGTIQTIGSAVQNVEKKENYISNLEGYKESNVKVNPKEDDDLNVASGENEEGQPSSDPLGDIASDIDSIVDESE